MAAGIALAAGVWAVYGPVLGHDFVHFDDGAQVIENPLVRSLGPSNLVRIFTSRCVTSYYPVRTLSFAVDYAFWRLDPTGFHLTNVVVHTANVLLVFWLALRLIGRPRRPFEPAAGPSSAALGAKEEAAEDVLPGRDSREPSGASANASGASSRSRLEPLDGAGPGRVWPVLAAAFGAGLFAFHPVAVEPVAWVAGREELLMVLGALGCLHFHLTARRIEAAAGGLTRTAVAAHVGAVLAAVAACWSNAMAAVLPAVVTGWDLLGLPRRRWLRSLVATAPLWALGVVTLLLKAAEKAGPTPAGGETEALSIGERALLVLNVYRANLTTLAWPANLTILHPDVEPGGPLSPGALAALAAVAGTIAALVLLRRRKAALFGLVLFLAGLAPSAQIIPHHIHRADRFLYLPLVGLSLAAGALIGTLRRRWARATAAVVAAAALAGWVFVDVAQVAVWRDRLTVFERAAELNPESPRVLNNLGLAVADRGDYDRAMELYRQALRIDPSDHAIQSNLGVALFRTGRTEEAINRYREALRVHPAYPKAHNNLANALAKQGRTEEAAGHYRAAIRADPWYTLARYNLATMLAEQGRLDEAVARFREALALDPDHVDAHNNLGNTLLLTGHPGRAVEHYRHALRVDPEHVEARLNLGRALADLGQGDEAVRQYERAVEIAPDHAAGRYDLATLLLRLGRMGRAVRHLEEVLRVRPDDLRAANRLAWILATAEDSTVGDPDRAVELAESVCRATNRRNAEPLHTLAAAYAAAGRLPAAVRTAEEALRLAEARGDADLVGRIRERLRRYRAQAAPAEGPPR